MSGNKATGESIDDDDDADESIDENDAIKLPNSEHFCLYQCLLLMNRCGTPAPDELRRQTKRKEKNSSRSNRDGSEPCTSRCLSLSRNRFHFLRASSTHTHTLAPYHAASHYLLRTEKVGWPVCSAHRFAAPRPKTLIFFNFR